MYKHSHSHTRTHSNTRRRRGIVVDVVFADTLRRAPSGHQWRSQRPKARTTPFPYAFRIHFCYLLTDFGFSFCHAVSALFTYSPPTPTICVLLFFFSGQTEHAAPVACACDIFWVYFSFSVPILTHFQYNQTSLRFPTLASVRWRAANAFAYVSFVDMQKISGSFDSDNHNRG